MHARRPAFAARWNQSTRWPATFPALAAYRSKATSSSDGRFASPEVLRRRFEAGLDADKELVCYCGSGVTACHNILAMRYAGLPEATLYAGSFSEWIRDPARPVER